MMPCGREPRQPSGIPLAELPGGSRLPFGVPPRLSKSRCTAGWQCEKLLWWIVHEPAAPELQPDKVLQDLFDQGRLVGELARARFPGGVLIDHPHTAFAERIASTRAALEAGAPAIFEAGFEHGGVFVAVDVLLRSASGWTLIEAKAGNSVKPEHIPDAAVQAWVGAGAGVPVTRVALLHLNRAYRHPGPEDLFAESDITAEVVAGHQGPQGNAARQLGIQL